MSSLCALSNQHTVVPVFTHGVYAALTYYFTDVDGVISSAAKEVYSGFGKAIACLFGDQAAAWEHAFPSVEISSNLTFNLPTGVLTGQNVSLMVQEDLTEGQLINRFAIDVAANGSSTWSVLLEDQGVGHKRIWPFLPTLQNVTAIRIRLLSSFVYSTSQRARIRRVALFNHDSPCV